jgi:hypothetical protein
VRRFNGESYCEYDNVNDDGAVVWVLPCGHDVTIWIYFEFYRGEQNKRAKNRERCALIIMYKEIIGTVLYKLLLLWCVSSLGPTVVDYSYFLL